jgi:hypothetical protein
MLASASGGRIHSMCSTIAPHQLLWLVQGHLRSVHSIHAQTGYVATPRVIHQNRLGEKSQKMASLCYHCLIRPIFKCKTVDQRQFVGYLPLPLPLPVCLCVCLCVCMHARVGISLFQVSMELPVNVSYKKPMSSLQGGLCVPSLAMPKSPP